MLTAPELERGIAGALKQCPKSLIVDLTRVDFLASHGMSVLVKTHDRCSEDTGFVVVANGPATSRPMQLVGLTDVITMRATLSSALRGLGG